MKFHQFKGINVSDGGETVEEVGDIFVAEDMIAAVRDIVDKHDCVIRNASCLMLKNAQNVAIKGNAKTIQEQLSKKEYDE